jgi:hypothetical protein
MSEPTPASQYKVEGKSGNTVSRVIAEKTIPYRPSLKGMTGSTNSAILIQQIAYWWYKSGEKPFYKFLQPCEHENYREGDSWAEELCFSYSELKTALENIAVKITAGVKKNELAEKNAVIYWTDSDRLTWWQFNPAAFELLYNSEKSNYLEDSEKSNYFNRINTENSTEIKESTSKVKTKLRGIEAAIAMGRPVTEDDLLPELNPARIVMEGLAKLNPNWPKHGENREWDRVARLISIEVENEAGTVEEFVAWVNGQKDRAQRVQWYGRKPGNVWEDWPLAFDTQPAERHYPTVAELEAAGMI